MGILNFHIVYYCFIFHSWVTCQRQEILGNFRLTEPAVVSKFGDKILPDGRLSFGIKFFHHFQLFEILYQRLVGKHHNS